MAPERSDDRAARLKREGRWLAFQAKKEHLRSLNQFSSYDIDALLTAEFKPLEDPTETPNPDPVEQTCSTGSTSPEDPMRDEDWDMDGVDFDKRVPIGKVVEWVFNNIDNPAATPHTAPSPAAWTMLKWAKQEPGRTDFLKNYPQKMIAQEVRVGVIEDDGCPDCALLDAFEATVFPEQSVYSPGAEGSEG